MAVLTDRVDEVRTLLRDERFDRPTNLARLQGWRGEDLDAAARANAWAHRVGPLTCSLLAALTAVTGSTVLLAITLASALIGAFASNHPAETAYNRLMRRRGQIVLPRNRAAKRLGCAVGSLFLIGSWIALSAGATVLGTGLLVALAVLAGFVGMTGVCVPSMAFTLLFGAQAGTRSTLLPAVSQPSPGAE